VLKSGILGESILGESVKVRAMRLDQLHTMQITFREICEGRRPWTALGDFLNYWWVYAKDRRYDLVVDPILEAPADEQYQRWAAYCAASVEHLCNKYNVPCPPWVHDSKYVLPMPWYCRPQERVRQWLVSSTPEEFRKRNIYSGDRMFLNKWELAERYQDTA
jgi:hypothetical protein